MRVLKASFLLLVFVGVLGWLPRASATAGSASDPAGDVFDQSTQKTVQGKLDIIGVDHGDDGKMATYTVTMKDGFVASDVHSLDVYISHAAGIKEYDCMPIDVAFHVSDGKLEGSIQRCLGSSAPKQFETIGSATAEHVDGSKTVTLSFDLGSLRSAGFTGSSYTYSILAMQTPDIQDSTADVVHTSSAPATPKPAPALRTAAPVVRTAAPTAATTPAPTVVRTPMPAVTVAPTAVVAKSFAAPAESRASGSSVALRIAGSASVLTAAGAAAALKFL